MQTATSRKNKAAPYDYFVIGLNAPVYIGGANKLVAFKHATHFASEAEAQIIADMNGARSGLEYYVDPVRDGKVVPIFERV